MALAASSVLEPRATVSKSFSAPASHIVAIDGARGLAMLFVFFWHVYPRLEEVAPVGSQLMVLLKALATVGNAGVTLFFVISGYLIYGIVLGRPIRYLSFLHRRFVRIFPTFVVVLTIYLLLSWMFPQQSRINGPMLHRILYIAANLLLLPGIFPIVPIITVAWTLSYEILYYLVVPGFMTLRAFIPSSYRVVALVVLGFLLLEFSFRAGLGNIVLGMAICELSRSPYATRTFTPSTNILSLMTLPATLVLAYHALTVGPYLPILNRLAYALLSINVAVLALYAFRFKGYLSAVLSFSPLCAFGRMSYSYYLIHGLTLNVVGMLFRIVLKAHHNDGTLLLATVFSFVATCVSGMALYWSVERPFSINKRGTGATHYPPASRSKHGDG